MQPDRTKTDESESIETLPSAPHGENTPANVPPPPPQSQQNNERQFGQGENKPNLDGLKRQSANPPSGPHPQPQTSYGDYHQQAQQLQQPYSGYQPNPPPQQQPYGGYQFTPPPQPPYGGYQFTPPSQQPYGSYQPNPPSQPPYGDSPFVAPPQQLPYNQPTESYLNYQQSSQPSLPGIAGGIAPIANTGPTATKPVTLQTDTTAWRKWAIIGVVVVVILAGSGVLALSLFKSPSPPASIPSVTVTSDFHDNGLPAGSGGSATDGTVFHVTGQKFSPHSAITFLLDSTIIETHTESDDNGALNNVDLRVTSSWPIGQHKLTAHDKSNNTTDKGVNVSIVPQGYAGTPGSNGAPTNTATFKVTIEVNMPNFHHQAELDVTARTDSQGGAVCSPGDDGSQQRIPIQEGDQTFYLVDTYACSGTYKAGDITYDEALNTRSILDSKGNTLCSLNRSQPSYIHVHGTYTTSHQFSGDITESAIASNQYTCPVDLGTPGENGTWTGTAS
jgi:hypothetical protein